MSAAVDTRPAVLPGDAVRDLRAAADILERTPEITVGTIIVFHPQTPDPVFGDLFVKLAGRRFLVTGVYSGGEEFGVVLLDHDGNEDALLSVVNRSEAEPVPSRYVLALVQTFRQIADAAEGLDMDIMPDTMIGRTLATARSFLPAVTA